MTINESNVIGKLVAADYRTAEVFGRYGIDFCCKGDLSIKEACDKKKIDCKPLIADLTAVHYKETRAASTDFRGWPADLLTDYIEKQHHRYVEQKTPVIQQYLKKVSSVHGAAHPELFDIAELFASSATHLAMHMKKEELILFPAIRRMTLGQTADANQFGSIENPVEMMRHEHTTEGDRFSRIAELSDDYTPPANACNTYRVTYALLKEFDVDLHRHIHLENNILFPKALEMEAALVSNKQSPANT